MAVRQPLNSTDTPAGGYRCHRRGRRRVRSRLGACATASPALLQVNPEFRPILKKAGFLTRDPRMKERKKYCRF